MPNNDVHDRNKLIQEVEKALSVSTVLSPLEIKQFYDRFEILKDMLSAKQLQDMIKYLKDAERKQWQIFRGMIHKHPEVIPACETEIKQMEREGREYEEKVDRMKESAEEVLKELKEIEWGEEEEDKKSKVKGQRAKGKSQKSEVRSQKSKVKS